ncbi:hypothetical protein NG896_15600 [Aeromonas veronii]|uniref:hypothetical protein n=1 Tax=Aeromonas veronii TaxID=654 RepID=UPI002090116C|nr:hypothetical protein [Aeromonas veronii]MCO5344002.1 hypothetical protein [Aeromonas veronii]
MVVREVFGRGDNCQMNGMMVMELRYRLALFAARDPHSLFPLIARAITVSTANTLFGRAGSQLAIKSGEAGSNSRIDVGTSQEKQTGL